MIIEKNSLKSQDESLIKDVFMEILQSGENYNVDEIESWFKNEGSWKNKKSILRITNMSQYIQEKYEQKNKFRVLSNKNSSDCD